MSDDMHFLAAGQPLLYGEKGFPVNFDRTTSCPEPVSPRLHPQAMALRDIATLWFRVAEWTMTSDIGGTSGTKSCGISGGVMANISIAPPTREFDYLLNSNYAGAGGTDQWNFRNSVGGSLVNFGMFEPGGFSTASFAICDNSGTFYPWLNLNGGCTSGGSDPDDVSIGFDSFNVGAYTDTGACNILGYSIPFGLGVGTVGGGPATLTGSTITFTPSLWWPYAARDSSPIYDIATGVALQDPAN